MFRQAEVEKLDSLFGEEDVAGLEVAMDDSLRVRGIQSVQDLRGVVQGLLQRQWTLQRSAFKIFHHQIIRPNVVQMANVWVVQRGNRVSFAAKTFAEVLGGNFDGYIPAQPRIARAIHLAHTARAECGGNFIGTEVCT